MVAWLADQARNGAEWAKDSLALKPCDLWPQLRGRTVWMVGDSISQVSHCTDACHSLLPCDASLGERNSVHALLARESLDATLLASPSWSQNGGRALQDMAFALSCCLVEYFDWAPGRQLAADPATKRSLTHSASGKELTTWCFNMTGDTRVCSLRANRVPRMANTILRLLPTIADRERDVAILNFGSWQAMSPVHTPCAGLDIG